MILKMNSNENGVAQKHHVLALEQIFSLQIFFLF